MTSDQQPGTDTAPEKKLELLRRLRQGGPPLNIRPEGRRPPPKGSEGEDEVPNKPAPILGGY